jgi:hypothetical protein
MFMEAGVGIYSWDQDNVVGILCRYIGIPEDVCAWDTKNRVRVWMARRIKDTETHRESGESEGQTGGNEDGDLKLNVGEFLKRERLLPWCLKGTAPFEIILTLGLGPTKR